MPHSPSTKPQNRDVHKHRSTVPNKRDIQHGIHSLRASLAPAVSTDATSTLLGLPTESLTHITAYLDPPALFVLSLVNRRLHEHIEDDNTWRRAYVYQFLGISPEGDIRDGGSPDGAPTKALMLRREESSWKREFVSRWNLRRRWERHRPATISHVPVHSAVSGFHLMHYHPPASLIPAPALLTSSLQYGIVARSYPLAGKVLRGYLDAMGTMNGMGIGNPNAEFTPDLTQCVIASDGGTARILWGFRNGTVAVTSAQKAMESNRATAARWTRCTPQDAHAGPIEHAVWVDGTFDHGGSFFVTAGIDGRVKLWDAKRVVCLWTSPSKQGLPIDPCTGVAVNVHGIIVAIFKSGTITAWQGLSSFFVEDFKTIPHANVQETSVTLSTSAPPYNDNANRKVLTFLMDTETPTLVTLLVVYEDEPYFYRVSVDLNSGFTERVAFGDTSLAPVTVLHSVFAEKPGDHSFLLAGDQLGGVKVYALDGQPTLAKSDEPQPLGVLPSSVLPLRQFVAHRQGSVSAIVWTPSVLLTGSSSGSIKAFDSLTFAPLRDFTTASSRFNVDEAVKQIVVERDFFAASTNDRIVAWHGEPAGKPEHGPRSGKSKRSSKVASGIAKWHQQVEMHRDIVESRRELEYEQAHTRQTFGRERDQQLTLDHLGLSEVEAVEYVLMLSRDEEEARRQQRAGLLADEGVFAGAFDEDLQTPVSTSSSLLDRPAANMFTHNGRTYPRIYDPSSHRLRISPRLRPEPMEAGYSGSPSSLSLSSSVSSSRSGSSSQLPMPDRGDPTHFPTISASSTPTRRSISGSPESARSAWSSRLRMTRSEGPSSPRGGGSLVAPPAPVSLLSEQFARAAQGGAGRSSTSVSAGAGAGAGVSASASASASASNGVASGGSLGDEDEDLKYAIELSLAEARSRGENV